MAVIEINGKKYNINKQALENYQAEVQSANSPTTLPELVVTTPKKNKLQLDLVKSKEDSKHASRDFLDFVEYKKLQREGQLAGMFNEYQDIVDQGVEDEKTKQQQKLSDPNFIHKINVNASDKQVKNTAFTDDKTLSFWQNAITPSQLVGAAIDGFQEGSYGGFVNSLKNGNSGFVSDNFYREHPFLSQIINSTGDTFIFGLPKLAPKAINYGYTKLVPRNWQLARAMNKSLKTFQFPEQYLPANRLFTMRDLSNGLYPAQFLLDYLHQDTNGLINEIRKNMDRSLDLMESRGVTGGYNRLRTAYDQMDLSGLNEKQLTAVKEYQNLVNNSKPVTRELLGRVGPLVVDKIPQLPFMRGYDKPYLINIRPSMFGNVSYYPYKTVFDPSGISPYANMFTKELVDTPELYLDIPLVRAHEIHHAIVNPYKKFFKPDDHIITSYLGQNEYLSGYNGTEMTARLSQLLNASGISDGNFKMTPKLLDFWDQYYVPLVQRAYPELPEKVINNDMDAFFNNIRNRKQEFLDWSYPVTLKRGGKLLNENR